MIKSIFCFKSKTENNKGQVAIFVALIFQIVFILFALLINVGLLIHHKINLQQSTDLAAYYGAMKQAEMLNVIGHVNFQTRQAFKLLTWRYRILGTFGFDKPTNPILPITFPISTNPTPPYYQYNQDSNTFNCDIKGDKIDPNTLPFMCLNHYGFKDYPANIQKSVDNNNETFCRIDCNSLENATLTRIDRLQESTGPGASQSASTINAINTAIQAANREIKNSCNEAAPITIANLARFYLSYFEDVSNKVLFMKMLFANLSADEKEMLDIEGNSIFKGTENTFINNLTEANNSSKGKDDNLFETFNSLSPKNGGDCSYSSANPAWKKPNTFPVKLFNELNFKFIQYFMLKCEYDKPGGPTGAQFSLTSIFGELGTKLEDTILTQLKEKNSVTIAQNIADLMLRQQHTIGIEKNPWCPVYYGVKASSTPVIPFLPISKIKLNSISFAKPFGGTIGPKIYNKWNSNENRSNSIGSGLTLSRTDPLVPELHPQEETDAAKFNSLKEQAKLSLNFSRFVGDDKGLADAKYIAIYHDMLRNRIVAGTPVNEFNSSNGKTEETKIAKNEPPEVWPAYDNWEKITEENLDNQNYDPLALDNTTSSPKNSYMRDIELSVVAPNQFDATYYSIEPDFYNVYVKGKLGEREVMEKLRSQAGLSGNKPTVPRDFGHTTKKIDGIPPVFSVRNQLEIVQHIFRKETPSPSNYGFSGIHSKNMSQLSSFYFSDVPYLQGSLLTGWTFQDFVSDDYSKIPNDSETKTPFAVCADQPGLQGSNGYGSIAEQDNPTGAGEKLPPAPGNCITGGRVGYSVKIISPKSLSESVELGGESTSGQILNPPDGFISF